MKKEQIAKASYCPAYRETTILITVTVTVTVTEVQLTGVGSY